MGDRIGLRAGQAGSRARRLGGVRLGRLAPAHHPDPVRLRLPGGSPLVDVRENAQKKRRFTALMPLTVPEVRRLLVRLVWAVTATPKQWLDRSRWRRRHQAGASDLTTRAAATHRERSATVVPRRKAQGPVSHFVPIARRCLSSFLWMGREAYHHRPTISGQKPP